MHENLFCLLARDKCQRINNKFYERKEYHKKFYIWLEQPSERGFASSRLVETTRMVEDLLVLIGCANVWKKGKKKLTSFWVKCNVYSG